MHHSHFKLLLRFSFNACYDPNSSSLACAANAKVHALHIPVPHMVFLNRRFLGGMSPPYIHKSERREAMCVLA